MAVVGIGEENDGFLKGGWRLHACSIHSGFGFSGGFSGFMQGF
jgi:hypothetical protein